MGEARTEPDVTRKRLKIFGIAVTDYEERAQALLEGWRRGGLTMAEQETLLREAADLTASLHHALREVTNHVWQLQSDFMMELVAREPPKTPDR